MTAYDLVNGASEVGITLWTAAGKLKYRSAGELDNGLRTRLEKHRGEIISILSARQRDLMALGYKCDCNSISYRQNAFRWQGLKGRYHPGFICCQCGTRYKFV